MTILFFRMFLTKNKFYIAVFLFLLIVIPFITFTLQEKGSEPSVTNVIPTIAPSATEEPYATITEFVPESESPQDNQQLTPPPFYPGLSWTVDDKQELGTDIKDRVIHYSSKNTFGYFGMTGKEWTATKRNISKEEIYAINKDFESYYDREVLKFGWLRDTEINGFSLSPMVADGPIGSIWGYIKVQNRKIEAIIFSWLPVSISGMGSTGKCPCDITFRIFVSNPQDLTKVLPTSP